MSSLLSTHRAFACRNRSLVVSDRGQLYTSGLAAEQQSVLSKHRVRQVSRRFQHTLAVTTTSHVGHEGFLISSCLASIAQLCLGHACLQEANREGCGCIYIARMYDFIMGLATYFYVATRVVRVCVGMGYTSNFH